MVLAVVLQVIGLALVAVAAALVYPPAAFAVVGSAAFWAGYERERGS